MPVLPAEPVTPTILPALRARAARPRSFSASVGVGDADVGLGDLLRDERARRARGEGLVDEAMAVGRLALHRDEQVARPDLARIEGDAGDVEIAVDGAAGGRGDLGGGPERAHRAALKKRDSPSFAGASAPR